MGPQPKRKISSGRRDRRRAHDALTANALVQCSNCNEMRLPHKVCPSCGYYRGREVVKVSKES
jgi:large subunit ribosomal protein L32